MRRQHLPFERSGVIAASIVIISKHLYLIVIDDDHPLITAKVTQRQVPSASGPQLGGLGRSCKTSGLDSS